PNYRAGLHAEIIAVEHTSPDAISAAARQVADTVGAAAIVSFTNSGATALRAARERPGVPTIALTARIETARRLALVWGLHCVQTSDVHRFSDMIQKATRIARQEGFAQKGQRVVITAGIPFGTPGATNVLHIAWVND
ncbi:MAG: pyruvate kinase alpha/beta domain-containing protein, partial [Stellaceae bacterium]